MAFGLVILLYDYFDNNAFLSISSALGLSISLICFYIYKYLYSENILCISFPGFLLLFSESYYFLFVILGIFRNIFQLISFPLASVLLIITFVNFSSPSAFGLGFLAFVLGFQPRHFNLQFSTNSSYYIFS